MIQQQNQQQPNNLQKKAEQALSAPFALPPIRTMADDLADASKAVNVPVVSAVSGSPAKVVQQPNIPKPPLPPRPPAVPAVPLPPKPVSTGNVVPPAVKENTPAMKKSFVASILIGAGVAVLVCVIGFAGYYFWPKKTGTVADLIPSETIAFISIKKDAGGLEKVALPKIAMALGLDDNSLGANWKNLVYGIIPGSTPSEPVGFLLTDDAASVQIGAVPSLAVKNLANNTAIIVETGSKGRVDGLSGKNLGDDKDFRALQKQLPVSPEYAYLAKNQNNVWLQPFLFLPVSDVAATLVGVVPAPQNGNSLVLMGTRSDGKVFEKRQLPWDLALKVVPATVLALTGHSDLAGDADQWRLSQSDNPAMQDLLNALTTKGESITALKDSLANNYVVGTLANGSFAPDGIAVLTIKEGMTENVKTQMRNLEEALKLLGPLVGGASYPDVAFSDANYQDTAIRFVNFGDSSHSFDYAIVDSQLLISTSKNSMQRMIETSKGDGDSFAGALTGLGSGQVEWQYLKLDTSVLDKLPTAWKILFSSFGGVYTEPIKTGIFTGNIAY